jgi:hypothetical protein
LTRTSSPVDGPGGRRIVGRCARDDEGRRSRHEPGPWSAAVGPRSTRRHACPCSRRPDPGYHPGVGPDGGRGPSAHPAWPGTADPAAHPAGSRGGGREHDRRSAAHRTCHRVTHSTRPVGLAGAPGGNLPAPRTTKRNGAGTRPSAAPVSHLPGSRGPDGCTAARRGSTLAAPFPDSFDRIATMQPSRRRRASARPVPGVEAGPEAAPEPVLGPARSSGPRAPRHRHGRGR